MHRRKFIGLLTGAAATLALPRTPAAEPTNAIQNPDMVHSMGAYSHIDNTGDYRGLSRQWILDPTCPRDTIYGFKLSDFPPQHDAQMYQAFARLEFEQRDMWPRSSRITNIAAEVDDAR